MRFSLRHSPRFIAATMGLAAVVVLHSGCQKRARLQEDLVRIDGTTISRASYESFMKMRRMYPTQTSEFFPRNRSPISFFIETELLYNKAKSHPSIRAFKASRDWHWKSRYFPAQLYTSEILDRNLGFSDQELEAYYNRNKEQFRTTSAVAVDTVKVQLDSENTRDSIVYRDSSYLRPFGQVQSEVVERLFFEKNPPDSGFRARYAAENASVDTNAMRSDWARSVRNNLLDHFTRRAYKKRVGSQLPETIESWYGEGKLITPEDMEVILSWIPEFQREGYRTDSSRVKELALWLLRWELLSNEAQSSGFSKTASARDMLQWAEKYAVVDRYVEEVLVPEARQSVRLDTAMALYAYWDEKGIVEHDVDSADFNRTLNRLADRELDATLSGMIYQVRKPRRIEFLQDDWRDDLVKDPVALMRQADSSRDSGNIKDAEERYRILVQSFPFTPEGRKSLLELAKIQTETEQYASAIDNYRRFLLVPDPARDMTAKCNTFFMIGFIYDEYQNRTQLAEANYTWVLKNTPDCDLADDAEFMLQHLDEPMTSVEELRGEALRQGRDVGEDETDEPPADSPTKS